MLPFLTCERNEGYFDCIIIFVLLNISVVFADLPKGRPEGLFLVFFRFSLHPLSCVVRSADESPDVLLFQMTEIRDSK